MAMAMRVIRSSKSCWVSKKKVLIICRDFPPYGDSAGATRRVESMFMFLLECGFVVRALASRGYRDVQKKEYANASYVDDFFQKRIGKAKHGFHRRKGRRIAKILRAFFKTIVGEFLVPDYGILMCRRYYRSAKKLLNSEKTDAIVTSGPVHSTHIVGLLLKRFYKGNIFWIADYRDSWNGSYLFRKRNMVANFLSRRLERSVLKECDHFTYVSNPILAKAIDCFGMDLSAKATLIMNGHSRDRLAAGNSAASGAKNKAKKKVGYFGYIDDCSGFRDVRMLLSYANASGFVISPHFEFYFFGEVRLFETDIRRFKNIFIHEAVAYRDVHEKMAEMDYLLIYHTERRDADEVVTGKLFDYMVASRPIICMGPPAMEAIRIIEGQGIGFGVDYADRKAVEEKFARLWENDFAYNGEFDLMKYGRDKQFVKLAEIIAGAE